MVQGDTCRYFAGLLVLYAAAEFLIKRFIWRSGAKHPVWSILLQVMVLIGMMGVGALAFGSWRLFGGILMFGLVRFLIDAGLSGRWEGKSLEKFVFVQAVTVFLLWWGVNWSGPFEPRQWYLDWEKVWRNPVAVYAIVSLYFFSVDGGARIVRGILDKFPLLMQRVAALAQTDGENRGEWIGILERVIALTFILTGNYTAVAFVLTAKSIARFKELDNKDFAEYYLLGTSASVVVALIGGTLVRLLL
jgi:hypothetical protein